MTLFDLLRLRHEKAIVALSFGHIRFGVSNNRIENLRKKSELEALFRAVREVLSSMAEIYLYDLPTPILFKFVWKC